MNQNFDTLAFAGLPALLGQAEEILMWLRAKPYKELKDLWKCNDKIAEQNFRRLEMQAKAEISGCKDLYGFWGDRLYREVCDESGIISTGRICLRNMCMFLKGWRNEKGIAGWGRQF